MKIKKLNSAGQDQRWNTHQKKPVHKLKSGQEKKTALIVGDSMLSGIDERRITQKSDIKVRLFPGATTQNM